MEGFLGPAHAWTKAVHVVAAVSWMAGMLYLPRLYAYHVDAEPGSRQSETFKVMERRLLRGIVNPAMILVFVLGAALAADLGAGPWSQGWWYVKLAALVAMAALHGAFARWRRAFAEDRNTRGARFYKLWNEAAAALMAIIVVMAVAKPF